MKFQLENMLNSNLYGKNDDVLIASGNGFLPYNSQQVFNVISKIDGDIEVLKNIRKSSNPTD